MNYSIKRTSSDRVFHAVVIEMRLFNLPLLSIHSYRANASALTHSRYNRNQSFFDGNDPIHFLNAHKAPALSSGWNWWCKIQFLLRQWFESDFLFDRRKQLFSPFHFKQTAWINGGCCRIIPANIRLAFVKWLWAFSNNFSISGKPTVSRSDLAIHPFLSSSVKAAAFWFTDKRWNLQLF